MGGIDNKLRRLLLKELQEGREIKRYRLETDGHGNVTEVEIEFW